MFQGDVRHAVRIGILCLGAMTGLVLAKSTPGGGGGGLAGDAAARAAVVQEVQEASRAKLEARRVQQLHAAIVRYHDVSAAQQAGYEPCGACQAAGGFYIDEGLVTAGDVDPAAPPVLRYEALADGGERLIGVTYVVPVEVWHENGHDAPPTLFGREFARDDTFLGEPIYLLVVPVDGSDPVGGFHY